MFGEIAPSVSGATYKLSYGGENNRFYLADTESTRDKITNWCIQNGYVERVDGWKAAVYDVETDEWRYTLYYDYDTAA